MPVPLAERATMIETEWAPVSEVPQQTPRTPEDDDNLNGLTLDMKTLATLPKALFACFAAIGHVLPSVSPYLHLLSDGLI